MTIIHTMQWFAKTKNHSIKFFAIELSIVYVI